jgi:glucose/arabinose dehydrogenase
MNRFMEKPLHPIRLVQTRMSIKPGIIQYFILFFILFLSTRIAIAQNLPQGFSQVLVANGISNPTVMAFAPDGRLFVAQQNGQLRVIKNGSLLSQPFISLSVNSSGERGLLGIAFDPNFSSNNYVYLYYTLSDASNNRISRFTANGDVVVAGSERVILELDPLSDASNHNGGTMQFGPDGKLYIGIGENADAIHSQQMDTYHGKILRINPDGSAPSDNPFPNGSQQQMRIWAMGVRNPFTIAFQPGTGRLFVNDVGSSSYEEINDATSGGKNFGWPQEEGYGNNYSSPIYAYPHGGGTGSGCAITGGTFFNPSSTNYPSTYNGRYFFLDYCNNWIDVLTLSGSSASRSNFATNIAGSAVGLTTGPDGNLYFLSRDNSAVYKIAYAGGSSLPVITNQPESITVAEGNNAMFSVSATGTGLTYQWRKNGNNINGANAATYTISSVTTANAGSYSVVVSNSSGSVTSSSATLTVTASNKPPVAAINNPAQGATYGGGSVISFSGSATDPEDGALGASAYNWYVVFYHDTHTHPGPATTANGGAGSFTIPTSGETSPNVFYRLYLVVTDPDGAKDTTYRDIMPRTSTITVNTNPQGLSVTLDGQPFTSPLTVTSVEGIVRSIGTTSPQTKSGTTYTFSSWSNGGSQTQSFATPVSDASFTANFSTLVVITGQPQSATVAPGGNVTFNVTASGSAPISYQWRKDGINISGATGSSYSISSVNSSHAGNYSVVVTNPSGSVTSANAMLTVTTAPVITRQPQNTTIAQGGNGSFSVTASGTAPLNYQWKKDGNIITGATSATFNINSATQADQGNYSVTISNGAGTITSNTVSLTVVTSPVITNQPANVTVADGAAASFNVTAAGTAPLTYQWKKNGVIISGANSATYSIPGVGKSDEGSYAVTVTNNWGSVTSNNAILIVTPASNEAPVARIISPAAGATYAGGNTISFSGAGTDTEDGTLSGTAFTWFVEFFHDNHDHPGPAVTTSGTNGSFVVPNNGETATDVFYRLNLVVTDKDGARDTAFVDIMPRLSSLTFSTSPAGLTVLVDGEAHVTPYSIKSVEGVMRSIGVTSPQSLNGIAYNFNNWTQGGAASQWLTTPVNDSTYTANFVAASTNDSLRNPDNPVNPVNGLDYSYYHGTWNNIPDFPALIKEKAGTVSNFDFSQREENDHFAFRYEGYVLVAADGYYTFFTASDEGSRLYIGDSLVVDNDGLHTLLEKSGKIGLKAGYHRIVVEYFEQSMQQQLFVSYDGPGITKQPIPDSVLYRAAPSTYVLTAIADAHVRTGIFENVNDGGSTTLNVGTTGDTYETYLRFDISGLPPQASSVTLRLFGSVTSGSSAIISAVQVPNWNWLERTITNSNKPDGGATAADSLVLVTTSPQFYEWNITNLINELRANGQMYVSLVLRNVSVQGGLATFHSREDSLNQPQLSINYDQAITATRPGQATSNSIAGLSKLVREDCLSVYPNPVRDAFMINFSSAFRNSKMQIADVNGRIVKEVILTGGGTQQVRVGDLKAGMYFISIGNGTGKCSRQVLIQR